jgi:hypothetical protein
MNGRRSAGRLGFCCTLAIVVDGAVLQQAWFDCLRFRALQICQCLQSLEAWPLQLCVSAIGAIDCVSTLNTGGLFSARYCCQRQSFSMKFCDNVSH